MEPKPHVPLCPSAGPVWPGSVAIGVIGGTVAAPLMAPLSESVPVTEELLALASPVTPTEVFRFAAPCRCNACIHFGDAKCGLAERLTRTLEPVTDELPSCSIRPRCRWWQQEGEAACRRCPQVVTDNFNPSAQMLASVCGENPSSELLAAVLRSAASSG